MSAEGDSGPGFSEGTGSGQARSGADTGDEGDLAAGSTDNPSALQRFAGYRAERARKGRVAEARR
ncbi:hypothetical protein [Streptomyces sp. NPDC002156]